MMPLGQSSEQLWQVSRKVAGANVVEFARLPQPDETSFTFPVDIGHQCDLLISFYDARLVDADGVHPEHSLLLAEPHFTERVFEILGDADFISIDEDA